MQLEWLMWENTLIMLSELCDVYINNSVVLQILLCIVVKMARSDATSEMLLF